jgi:hypothetical protein
MMLRPALLAFSLLLAGAAAGPAGAQAARTVNVTVYGNDPCPRGGDGEIVVCGHRSENERYRIPKELRHKNDQPSEVSWASRVAGLDEGARAMRPDSCSPVGSYGQTGCFQKMIGEWAYERGQMRSQQAGVP